MTFKTFINYKNLTLTKQIKTIALPGMVSIKKVLRQTDRAKNLNQVFTFIINLILNLQNLKL